MAGNLTWRWPSVRRTAPAALLAAALLVGAGDAQADTTAIGLMVDAGVPDGANASLVYRPLSWLRLHGGGGYNMISPGIRAGVSVLPPWIVSPSLVVEAGRYFEGDANPLMRKLSGDPEYDNEALREVGYDYANAHLGLELGSHRATFYVHAGFSYIAGDVNGANALFDGASDDASVMFEQAPRVTGLVPSARLGLIVYLF